MLPSFLIFIQKFVWSLYILKDDFKVINFSLEKSVEVVGLGRVLVGVGFAWPVFVAVDGVVDVVLVSVVLSDEEVLVVVVDSEASELT